MKRYLLFTGQTWYPLGGWDDYRGDFDNCEDALLIAVRMGHQWGEIVDTTTMKVIRSWGDKGYPQPQDKF